MDHFGFLQLIKKYAEITLLIDEKITCKTVKFLVTLRSDNQVFGHLCFVNNTTKHF